MKLNKLREVQRIHFSRFNENKTELNIESLLLAERVQAGQNLWVVVTVQTDAADQKLLVYLPDDWAGAAGLTLGHND